MTVSTQADNILVVINASLNRKHTKSATYHSQNSKDNQTQKTPHKKHKNYKTLNQKIQYSQTKQVPYFLSFIVKQLYCLEQS